MSKILIDEGTVKLALEALQEVYFDSRSAKHDEAITALREALAVQPAPQVVDCHTTGVCVQSGLRAEQPAQPAQQEPESECNPQDLCAGCRCKYAAQPAQQEPVYHLRQYGDVTKEQLDRYMATGDINPQPAPVQVPTDQDLMRCWVEKPSGEIDGIASMRAVLNKFGNAPNPAQPRLQTACIWSKSNNDHTPDTWHADCGATWTFTDGSPVDNEMKYCCGCGAILLEKNT